MNIEEQNIDEQFRQALSIATMEEYKHYEARLHELGEFIAELRAEWYAARIFLNADWTDIGDYLESDDFDSADSTQHLRRSLVRTLFAMIEGITYAYKQQILADYRAGRCQVYPAEYAILMEEAYQLRDNGSIRPSPNYANIKANIRFTLPLYAHIWGVAFEFDPPVGAQGWQSLDRSIEIRNRLMHPKSLEELNVTDADLDDIFKAAEWFTTQIDRLESLPWRRIVQLWEETQAKDRATPGDLPQEPSDD